MPQHTVMEEIYTTIDTVATHAAGSSKHIRFSAILCLMQDAAYAHATRLGVGYEHLLAHKRAFVLSRLQIKVCSELPVWGDRIVLQTWPRGLDKLYIYRDFELSREGREPFLKATSAWLLIDTDARRATRPQEFLAILPARTVKVLDDDAPRKLAWDEATQPFDIRRARAPATSTPTAMSTTPATSTG